MHVDEWTKRAIELDIEHGDASTSTDTQRSESTHVPKAPTIQTLEEHFAKQKQAVKANEPEILEDNEGPMLLDLHDATTIETNSGIMQSTNASLFKENIHSSEASIRVQFSS